MIQLPLQFVNPKNHPKTCDFGRYLDVEIGATSLQRIVDYASKCSCIGKRFGLWQDWSSLRLQPSPTSGLPMT